MSAFSLFFTSRLSVKQWLLLMVLLSVLTWLYLNADRGVSVVIFIVALAMGATLNGLHFGFSRSFRELLLERKTLAVRAMLVMLALAIILFSGLQQSVQSLEGQTLQGFVRPVGIYSLVGAFVFGLGMQLGIGCTSGTLNRAGQLQVLSLPTLLMMIVGGTFAVWSQELWQDWPAIAPWAFQQSFHWLIALCLQLLLLLVIYRGLLIWESSVNENVQKMWQPKTAMTVTNWHPWLLAAISLAALNGALFWMSGAPWSISSIFPYWGIHLIEWFELPIDWRFWAYAMENPKHLAAQAVNHTVSLTTWGVLMGALWVTLWRVTSQAKTPTTGIYSQPWQAWMISAFAGLLMGLGAVMASGCNIGAFFSGIASGSLHGWIWLPFALLGNWIVLRFRSSE